MARQLALFSLPLKEYPSSYRGKRIQQHVKVRLQGRVLSPLTSRLHVFPDNSRMDALRSRRQVWRGPADSPAQ